MASQGPLSAGSGADDAAVGTVAWANPTNITVSDNTRSATGNLASSAISHYLKSSSHGFSIPAGATIDGIVVEIERSQNIAQNVRDSRVRIVKADGSVGTTDKADTATDWPVGAAEAYKTYGSSTDLWGETWTATDINDADFGVVVAATNASATNTVARVDHVRITVHYTESGTAHTKNLDDTITATDAVGKATGKANADTLTANDATGKGVASAQADTLTASDAAVKAVGLGRADTLTASDALSRAWAAKLTPSDTLTAADAIAKGLGRPLSDSLALSDGLNVVVAPFSRPWTYGGTATFTYNHAENWTYTPVTG